MSLYVLDTDVFSLYRGGIRTSTRRSTHTRSSELAITVITVEEEVAGWYSLLRQAEDSRREVRAYEHLAEAIPLLARWQIIPVSLPALTRYEALIRMKLNVRKMDLRIAGDRPGDRRDPGFPQPPGLPTGPGTSSSRI